MRICYVDGDGFLYKSAYAGEFKNPFISKEEVAIEYDLEIAVHILMGFLRKIQERTDSDRLVVTLGSWQVGATYFRHRILPSYKHNRVGATRPKLYNDLRKFLEKEYCTYSVPDLEGEDLVGLLVTLDTGWFSTCSRIACSLDKDLLTVPCFLYNPSLDVEGVREISKDEAHRYHMLQTLMGDPVDGYDGIPGIGPKKAERILDGIPTEKMWDTVVEAYEKYGYSEEDALTQSRLAFILRMPYYDFKKRELAELWVPPKLT